MSEREARIRRKAEALTAYVVGVGLMEAAAGGIDRAAREGRWKDVRDGARGLIRVAEWTRDIGWEVMDTPIDPE
jgi:hypothetical protein